MPRRAKSTRAQHPKREWNELSHDVVLQIFTMLPITPYWPALRLSNKYFAEVLQHCIENTRALDLINSRKPLINSFAGILGIIEKQAEQQQKPVQTEKPRWSDDQWVDSKDLLVKYVQLPYARLDTSIRMPFLNKNIEEIRLPPFTCSAEQKRTVHMMLQALLLLLPCLKSITFSFEDVSSLLTCIGQQDRYSPFSPFVHPSLRQVKLLCLDVKGVDQAYSLLIGGITRCDFPSLKSIEFQMMYMPQMTADAVDELAQIPSHMCVRSRCVDGNPNQFVTIREATPKPSEKYNMVNVDFVNKKPEKTQKRKQPEPKPETQRQRYRRGVDRDPENKSVVLQIEDLKFLLEHIGVVPWSSFAQHSCIQGTLLGAYLSAYWQYTEKRVDTLFDTPGPCSAFDLARDITYCTWSKVFITHTRKYRDKADKMAERLAKCAAAHNKGRLLSATTLKKVAGYSSETIRILELLVKNGWDLFADDYVQAIVRDGSLLEWFLTQDKKRQESEKENQDSNESEQEDQEEEEFKENRVLSLLQDSLSTQYSSGLSWGATTKQLLEVVGERFCCKLMKNGTTLLHILLGNGSYYHQTGYVQYLLRYVQGDIITTNQHKESLLHAACRSSFSNVLSIITRVQGININVLNANGDSMLHLYSKSGDITTALLLVKMGADPNLQNAAGKRAADLIQDHFNSIRNSINEKYRDAFFVIPSDLHYPGFKQPVATAAAPNDPAPSSVTPVVAPVVVPAAQPAHIETKTVHQEPEPMKIDSEEAASANDKEEASKEGTEITEHPQAKAVEDHEQEAMDDMDEQDEEEEQEEEADAGDEYEDNAEKKKRKRKGTANAVAAPQHEPRRSKRTRR